MPVLRTSGGSRIASTTGVATRISDDPKGSIHKAGNFQQTAASPWSAWTGMWGTFVGGNESMTFTVDQRVSPTLFPATTKFTWSITPDPDYSGINGYLHVDYGNYDDSPGTITPRQVSAITAMSLNASWTYNGDPASSLLAECWLTPTSRATGSTSGDALFEIGFFPKVSAGTQSWLSGLSNVGTGSFTDTNGATWNVKQSNTYLVAYRPSYADHQGVLPFKEYFTFLTTSGKLAGTEWFNGVAFGVEPLSGSSSVTINSLSATYA